MSEISVSVEYHITRRAETYICFCTTHDLRVVVGKINVLNWVKERYLVYPRLAAPTPES